MPGGDSAIRHPVRQLVARWTAAGCDISTDVLHRLHISAEQVSTWRQQSVTSLNSPRTHAAGRVFDAFSCALGLCPDAITYEAQGPILLETAARRFAGACSVSVPFETRENSGLFMVDWTPAFELAMELVQHPGRDEEWALAFHHAVARACAVMLDYGLAHSRFRTLCLTGGVFMNRLLVELTAMQISRHGVRLLQHHDVPPNDGGLSLGQAVAAGWII